MRRLVCGLAVALSACNGQANPQPQPERTPKTAATATATASSRATASASSSGARAVSEETDDFLFEYSYPKEAGRIPELAAMLDQRLDKARADLVSESSQARAEARSDGFPYNKHSSTVKWKTVAELPAWLSLSAEVSSYTGGAHGNYGFDSLVWSKQTAAAMEAIALFESPSALDRALGDKLCSALDKERAKRRGADAGETTIEEFDKCVPVKDATVLVGSRGRRKFDRLTVEYGPYAAGPYAEGAYVLDFPVDRAVLGAVKPEFKDAFAARN